MINTVIQQAEQHLVPNGMNLIGIDYMEQDHHTERYKRVKQELISKGITFTESTLYHGTSPSNAESILSNKFDITKLNSGPSIWFGVTPSTSLRYCMRWGIGTDGRYVMLASRILLVPGNGTLIISSYYHISDEVRRYKENYWHTENGSVKVLFNADCCYPLVKITFKPNPTS